MSVEHYDLAARLHAYLGGRRISYSAVGEALDVDPNSLRYAALTGTVLLGQLGAEGDPRAEGEDAHLQPRPAKPCELHRSTSHNPHPRLHGGAL